jgi:hypothetical protein
MTIADRRADRQRCPVDRPRRLLVIEIYEPYPARLRFQVQQGSKGLAGSRPVDVMTILQSKAEPVRQRRLAVNGRAMRQSRVALADATEPAGQPRSQGSALVSQRKPFAWYPVPGASTASARQKVGRKHTRPLPVRERALRARQEAGQRGRPGRGSRGEADDLAEEHLRRLPPDQVATSPPRVKGVIPIGCTLEGVVTLWMRYIELNTLPGFTRAENGLL